MTEEEYKEKMAQEITEIMEEDFNEGHKPPVVAIALVIIGAAFLLWGALIVVCSL